MRLCAVSLFVLLLPSILGAKEQSIDPDKPPLKIGWIGPLTGPSSKLGAAGAAVLALEDINAAGGVNGRRVELIQEDSQGRGSLAASAFQKLTRVDKVRFIVGGHCTPESAAIAPLAMNNRVAVLAVTTSTPKLSGANPYFARTTYISTVSGAMVADYAFNGAGVRRLAIIQEQTDYVLPVAEKVKQVFEAAGGKVVSVLEVPYGETDFRTAAARIKASKADGVYIGVQAPDTASLVLRQLHEVRFEGRLFGNESVGMLGDSGAQLGSFLEGVIFAEPEFNAEAPAVISFARRYEAKFGGSGIPAGFHTADAYDAVRLMADTIGKCGEDPGRVAQCLRSVKDYPGLAGRISINQMGDGVREVVLKRITSGVQSLSPATRSSDKPQL